tara:strand:+ start:1996 stop:2178 length:183 start_codon:yes stop_codon:yes gene_type:complete
MKHNTVTREKAQGIVDHNTKGKGKNNPNNTCVMYALRWLSIMDNNKEDFIKIKIDQHYLR